MIDWGCQRGRRVCLDPWPIARYSRCLLSRVFYPVPKCQKHRGYVLFWQFDNCVVAIAGCKNDWAFVSLVSQPPGEDVGWPASRLPR